MFKSLKSLFEEIKLRPSQVSHRGSSGRYQQDSFDFLSLIEKWPEIVGPRLAKHTLPLKNKNKTLVVLTNHAAFSQQLSFMEQALCQKVVEKFPALKGKVQRIQFQNNPHFFEEQKKLSGNKTSEKKASPKIIHKFSPEYKKLQGQASDLLSDIEDAELKETLTSLFLQGREDK